MTMQNAQMDRLILQLQTGDHTYLEIKLPSLTQDSAAQLAEVIASHGRHLETLVLNFAEVEDGALSTLLNSVSESTRLKALTVTGFDASASDLAAVGEFLASGVALNVLKLKELKLRDADMEPIGAALMHQPGLVELSLNENPTTGASMAFLLPAMKNMHHLSSFYFNAEKMSAQVRVDVSETFSPDTHPNLVNCSITTSGNIASQNERRLLKMLNDMHSMEFDCLSLGELQSIEQRLTGLNIAAENASYLSQGMINYELYLNGLPVMPKDKPVTLADLMVSDERGLCALDDPQLWKNHPTLLAELAENGELTPKLLNEPTARGYRVIDYIAAFAPPQEAIAILAESGAPVRAEWLVTEDGTASETLWLLQNQYEGLNALFQNENWEGATMRELNRVLGALTEETRDSIANLHGLRASIGRDAPRQAER